MFLNINVSLFFVVSKGNFHCCCWFRFTVVRCTSIEWRANALSACNGRSIVSIYLFRTKCTNETVFHVLFISNSNGKFFEWLPVCVSVCVIRWGAETQKSRRSLCMSTLSIIWKFPDREKTTFCALCALWMCSDYDITSRDKNGYLTCLLFSLTHARWFYTFFFEWRMRSTNYLCDVNRRLESEYAIMNANHEIATVNKFECSEQVSRDSRDVSSGNGQWSLAGGVIKLNGNKS